MIGLVVRDWQTVRVDSTQTTFVQPACEWLDLASFEDVSLWLEVRSVQAPGTGVTVDIHYETSPNRDDLAFKAMASFTLAAATGPTVTNVILDRNPTTPLARWFRFKLKAVNGPTGRWGACFRLLATVTPFGRI
jgi:hypothetical protein